MKSWQDAGVLTFETTILVTRDQDTIQAGLLCSLYTERVKSVKDFTGIGRHSGIESELLFNFSGRRYFHILFRMTLAKPVELQLVSWPSWDGTKQRECRENPPLEVHLDSVSSCVTLPHPE